MIFIGLEILNAVVFSSLIACLGISRFRKNINNRELIWSGLFFALGCLLICISGNAELLIQQVMDPLELRQFIFNLGLAIAIAGIYILIIYLLPSSLFSRSPFAAMIGIEIILLFIRLLIYMQIY